MPYLAWGEYDGTSVKARVARWDAGAGKWVRLGDGSAGLNAAAGDSVGSPIAVTDVGGVPWIAFGEQSGTATALQVMRLAAGGSEFEHVADGTPIGVSGEADSWPSLATFDGIPWLGWTGASGSTAGSRSQIRVARLEPDFLAQSALATQTGADLLVDVRRYGLPYQVGFKAAGLQTSTAQTFGDQDTIVLQIGGLKPGKSYSFQPMAEVGFAPLALGQVRTFATEPGGGTKTVTKLLVGLLTPLQTARRGHAITVSYLATTAASVELDVLRAGKVLVRIKGRAVAGRNRLRWGGKIGRRSAKTGTYMIVLKATAGSQRAKDSGRVKIVR